MRIYLDNCCFNRPFDRQGGVAVVIEALAKLQIQALMYSGAVEYVWSDILSLEVSRNPYLNRRRAILAWIAGATEYVVTDSAIESRGHEIEALGVKPKDALHLASAAFAACDWFLTTDKGILKKVRELGSLRVANPVEFMVRERNDD